jgi:hypothetical protein
MTTTITAQIVISDYGPGPLNTVKLGTYNKMSPLLMGLYRGADNSLARPTSHVFCLMVRIFRLMLVLLCLQIVLIFLQL